MEKLRAFGVKPSLLTGLAAAWMLVMLLLPLSQVFGQEQFFTQSGGRGLQNAKTNARITKVETDVDAVKAQVAKIQPFAYAQLGTCSEDGEKLRWDGTNWICESETDPTVMPWAKKALPTCGSGTMLGVVNGEFSCVNMGFISTEVDPTVQAWAKSPLPNCGIGEILAVGGDRMLVCSKDYQGVSKETDPNIFDFAHKDIVGALPNCTATENLTMMNGRLMCKSNTGVTVEADPKVQPFARNDVTGATLAACASGEVLTAVDTGGNVVLKCASATGSLAEVLALNDLRDVSVTSPVSNSVLAFNGSGWTNAKESDPIITAISACAANGVLSWDGTQVKCVTDIGSSGTLHLGELADVSTVGQDDGNLLQYSSTTHTWRPYQLPQCTTGKILTTNGVDFSCVNDAGGVADPLDLNELGDVRTSSLTALSPADEDLLRWDSSSSKWKPIHDRTAGSMTDNKWCHYQGDTSTGEIVCDRGAPQQCVTGQVLVWVSSSAAFNCVSATSSLGLGTMAAQNADDVSITGGVINGTVIGGTNPAAANFTNVTLNNLYATGLVRATAAQVSSLLVQGNLDVTGNLNISGTQTIDGVTFANGGIQLSGSIVGGRLDSSYISTSVVSVTNNLSADRLIANHFNGGDGTFSALSATNASVTLNQTIGGDLRVGGNFYVSGSQSIDGVIFANGGIALSGTVGAGNISATNISGTYADIRNLSVTNGALVGTDVTVTRDVGVGRNLWVNGYSGLNQLGVNNVSVTNRQDVGGDLHVGGSLYVSGSQSIDGVLFANGGIVLSGTVGAGNISATNISGTYADIRNLSVTNGVLVGTDVTVTRDVGVGRNLFVNNYAGILQLGAGNVSVTANQDVGGNLHVGGDFTVSGSQTIDGVVFANGGIVLSGTVGAGNISATNISGTYADIRNLSVTNGALVGTDVTVTRDVGVGRNLFVNNYAGITRLGAGNISVTANADVGGDLRVGGNLYVSGSQSIDGVLFANGGIQMSGTVTSGNLSATNLSATTADIRNLSVTNGALVGTDVTVTRDIGVGRNLFVTGASNMTGLLTAVNVSSSGGVSVTGNVSANRFIGNGSELTGITAGNIGAAGVSGSVQFKGASGEISGTNTFVWENASNNLNVSGTVQMSGTGGEACGVGAYGQMRFVNVGGGDFRMQFCRP